VRILALGQGLPDPAIDNFNWASALSFYDYDAIVVEPSEAVSRFVEAVSAGSGSYLTYDDIPVAEGPTNADNVGLVDVLRRRRDEVERLLARGGLVVCFGYPDVPHPRVAGFTGCHRYYWLPAPPGFDYGAAHVKPASGRSVRVTDWEHPFAAYLDAQRDNVLYRAAFPEGAAGFPDLRVIGRSPAGVATAVELPVGGGRVVFLPAWPPSTLDRDRSAYAGNLAAAIRNSLLMSAEGEPPEWVDELQLPGIDLARREMEDAEAKLDDLEASLDHARNRYRSLDRYRRILWQEGKYGFELPVRDALALLGATPYGSTDEPATFSMAGEVVLVEAESSEAEVGMEPHYRLRERLEAKIVDDRRRRRGLIVVNGFRQTQPGRRDQQYIESLRVAAESMRYCILEAGTLFEAVKHFLEGKGDPASLLKRITETEGALAPPPEEATDSTAKSPIKN
jgi:hypothetical protein